MPSAQAEAPSHVIAAAQQGSRVATDALVRGHEGWLRSVIYGITGRRDLVDDVAQQVWTRVWQRIDTLQDPARWRAWLYRIARHTALDMASAAKRRRTVPLEVSNTDTSVCLAREPHVTLADDEIRDRVLAAVHALPALYREPLVLRHLHDWSYAEIAEVLELPIDTVETRLARARRLLRDALQGKVPG